VIDRTSTLALELLPRSFRVEDVHALFQGLGLTHRQAAPWLHRMVQSGRIERSNNPSRIFTWSKRPGESSLGDRSPRT